MRLVFAGTPAFAATALEALAAAGHDIAAVLTQPDRPAGRGLKLAPSPVKVAAVAHGLPVLQPASLRDPGAAATLAALAPEVLIVVAYGQLLPPEVLALAPAGCLNIHASLLPRWRGAAPIQRALLAGDAETGVTIMRMEAGLDTGPMLLRHALPIHPRETAATLHDRLAALGAQMICEALDRLPQLAAVAQDASRATWASKLSKAEGRVDWRQDAAAIDRMARAFNPFPVAWTELDGETWRIWRAEPTDGQGRPGEILAAGAAGVVVACGQGALRLLELQRPGGKRQDAAPFAATGVLAGRMLGAGTDA